MPSRRNKRGPALLLTIFGAAALFGCNRLTSSPAAICASDGSIARLKSIVFEHASAMAPAALRPQLPTIASQTQVKLIAPIVVAYNRDSRRVTCQAQAQFQLPPGVTMPTANPHAITQQVSFSSQPYADGSGRTFQLFDDGRLAVAIGVASLAKRPAPQQQPVPVQTAQAGPASPAIPARGPQQPVPVQTAQAGPVAPAVAARAAQPLPAPPPVRSAPAREVASTEPPPPTPPRRPARPPDSQLAAATARSAQPRDEPPAAPRERTPESPPPDLGYVDAPTRVFIHIADPAQRAAADRLQRSIGRYSVEGAPVATPPVRVVGRTPGRPEIRCLKAADCAKAERLADRLAADLGERPVVVDLHTAFENDPHIRRGSLELWLPSTRR